MKCRLIFFFAMMAYVQSKAQYSHMPNPVAKQLNDKAVGKYIKYNAFPDSVVAAIALLDKAISADSFYYNAWTNKLGYECQLKRYDEAIQTAGNIFRIFPKMNDILFFRGILQFKTRHDNDAIATFEQLIKIYDNKKNSEDLKTDVINKAIAMKLIGKTEEGNQILKKLAEAEHDPAIKSYIESYITDSKEKIIEQMVPGS